jgi:catechol 2,3-dioxygenase-like lactoylglutathione lyase family enzyme
MITGAHLLFYSTDPDADRAFLRDVLEFRGIDIGHGWLIVALPPSEAAVHPAAEPFVQDHAGHAMLGAVLYLMTDDLAATIAWLGAKGVACTEIQTASWGSSTAVRLPSGAHLGLYQPTHPTAIGAA